MQEVTQHSPLFVRGSTNDPDALSDDSARWQTFVSSVRALPVLADSLYQLSNLLMVSPVDLSAATNVLRQDFALAAQVLKLANLGPLDEPTADLETALVHLGLEPLRVLILNLPVLPTDAPAAALDLWRHSHECAQACEWLAQRTGLTNWTEPYTYGLLHDLGRIPLLAWQLTLAYSGRHPCVNELVLAAPGREDEEFGINHQVTGGWMAVTWNYPNSLVEAAEAHHDTGSTSSSVLATLVRAADAFSMFKRQLISREQVLTALLPVAFSGGAECLLDAMSTVFSADPPDTKAGATLRSSKEVQ